MPAVLTLVLVLMLMPVLVPVLVLVLTPMPAQAAEPQAVLTLLEGEATVVIGSRAYAAATGARLGAGAIVETDAKATLLRLEWPSGAMLDLGPATRVMLRLPQVYLLQGWAKQSQTTAAPGPLTSAFDVQAFKGVLVSQVDGNTTVLFAESGDKQLSARRSGKPLTLAGSQAAVQGADGGVQVIPRPPAGWLQSLPRAFRDTLPPKAAQFKGPPPVLKARLAHQAHQALSYAALQPWLTAEALVRHDFPTRFAALLQDPEFRSSVLTHLRQHPEWETTLHPAGRAKLLLKPMPKPSSVPNASTDPEPPR